MLLLPIATVGLLVPGGLFIYWLLHDASSWSAALHDRMAIAFFVDLVMSTFLVAWLFARRPVGPVAWPWFVVLSLLGTLAFGIPMFLWLNWRLLPAPRPKVASWLSGRTTSASSRGLVLGRARPRCDLGAYRP